MCVFVSSSQETQQCWWTCWSCRCWQGQASLILLRLRDIILVWIPKTNSTTNPLEGKYKFEKFLVFVEKAFLNENIYLKFWPRMLRSKVDATCAPQTEHITKLTNCHLTVWRNTILEQDLNHKKKNCWRPKPPRWSKYAPATQPPPFRHALLM